MPPACSVRASMCERFSTGWGTNRWRRPCGIWYRRAMFTTGLIRLSYPASLRTQTRQGNPFNRKSPDRKAVRQPQLIPSALVPLRWAEAPTRKMFLELFVHDWPVTGPAVRGGAAEDHRVVACAGLRDLARTQDCVDSVRHRLRLTVAEPVAYRGILASAGRVFPSGLRLASMHSSCARARAAGAQPQRILGFAPPYLVGDSGDVNGRFRRCEYSRSEATLADAMMPEFIHIGQWGGDRDANWGGGSGGIISSPSSRSECQAAVVFDTRLRGF